MCWTLSKIAATLGLELKGKDCSVTGINTLECAGPSDISFLANPKYAHHLPQSKACAVIVTAQDAEKLSRVLISTNPYADFGRAVALFAKKQGSFDGMSGQCHISPSATVEPDCTIYPFVYVGERAVIGAGCVLFPGCYIGEDCRVGPGCILYPNAVLMAGTVLGKGCIIHPGAVLGADGFGFSRSDTGILKIPQIGTVQLGDTVEVGANTTVDRAVLNATRIGDSTKIDNLVQIGHNVSVGKECFLVSQVGISGSTTVGDRVTMAGQVGVSGHLCIGNNVTIGPQSGVAKSIPDNVSCGGTPCTEGRNFLRTIAVVPKLPDMYRRLGQLENELAALKRQFAKEDA